MWELHNYTNDRNHGYYTLTFNGIRICDAFPYRNTSETEIVKDKIQEIFETMTRATDPKTKKVIDKAKVISVDCE